MVHGTGLFRVTIKKGYYLKAKYDSWIIPGVLITKQKYNPDWHDNFFKTINHI